MIRKIRSPQGFDSLEPVRIGGIYQWIEVRGQNVNNPILLFIHGGPGIAFIGKIIACPGKRGYSRVCSVLRRRG